MLCLDNTVMGMCLSSLILSVVYTKPTNMRDLLIPEKYTYTVAGDKFLQFDSCASDNRIIIFSTQKNLDLMATCDHWYADGTFKTSPPLFKQVSTIHAIKYNNVLPTFYSLLPDICQDTYSSVLDKLKLLKPGLSPVSVMTDFENAQINAFSHNFPDIRNRGCFFHFSQCIWRKIQTIADIRSKYEDKDDLDFALNVRKLAALAFVPEPDVVDCFERLLRTKFYMDNEDLMSDLASFDDLPKTNNAVEGWHRGFSSLLGANHPSIWKFIEGLQNQQSLNQFQINQYIAGLPPAQERRCYRDTAFRIKEIVEDYGNRDTSDYLQGIAHHFQFQSC
ncbi:uncharacterized protein LOC111027604 [Myzus persicae]|uniref:uncharacterized protein LOC111027604 n=1 Tax=Myzus persicae TaxID=13164 RepID=UPI000B932D0B|nr:uncharacterized protein LOC111027604 [Myzus persicae]